MSSHQHEPATPVAEPARDAVTDDVIHLRAAGVSLLLAVRDGTLPAVLHWGHDLGDLTPDDLADLALAGVPGTVPNDLDGPARPGAVLPEHRTAGTAGPGLVGSRSGRGLVAAVRPTGFQVDIHPARWRPGGRRRSPTTRRPRRHPRDGAAAVGAAAPPGRGRVPRADGRYEVDGLALTLPGATGRHRAVRPRRALGPRAVAAAQAVRRRRALAGEPARPHRPGRAADPRRRHRRVRLRATARCGRCTSPGAATTSPTPSGSRPASAVLGGGELLLPGEIALGAGETYTGPWIYGAYGVGLDGVAARFHTLPAGPPAPPATPAPGRAEHLGGRVLRPRPRPAHRAGRARPPRSASSGTCSTTAGSAHRRDDRAGLGDWYVDARRLAATGLHPLVDRVRGLGMEFGLWVEPEMVNPDSDLARAHPDWILRHRRTALPPTSRHQQVLDLGPPRRLRLHPGAARRAARPSTRSTTSSGTTTGT